MTDDFQAWRDALATGQPIAYEKGNPCSGFYRRRYSNRRENLAVHWQAVAIWRQPTPGGGSSVCAMAGSRLLVDDIDAVDELFATCAKHPITEDLYYGVTENGAPWPDDIPELASERVRDKDVWDIERVAHLNERGMGDNSAVPPAERMKGDVEELARAARDFLKEIGGSPRTKDEADKLANFKTKLTELKTSSEAQRTEEKRPHLEAGRAVDETWKPVVALAEAAAKDCGGPLAAWLRAEQQRQEAEAKAAREEQARIERALEAERVAKMAEAFAKGEPLPEPEPERPAYVAPAAPQKVSVGTRRGVSLRTRTVYEIADLKAATVFVLDNCTTAPPADLVAAVQTAVNKLMKAGIAVPGVATKEVDCA